MPRVRPVLLLVVVAAVLGAVLPSSAAAATAPDAFPFDATITGATTATLNGEVDANGAQTTLHFAYSPATDDWCTSGGTTGAPDQTTTPQTVPANFSDSVSADVTGLTAGTDYCFGIVASSTAGDADLSQASFTAGAPGASTNDVTITGAATASVSGSVNPAGQSTTYHVEYAEDGTDFCNGDPGQPHSSTSNTTLPQQDTDSHEVSVALSGLTPGTQYCAELVATAGSVSTRGGLTTFTAGLPAASLNDVSSTSGSAATVSGSINPSGQTGTTYHVDYDVAGSDFCSGTSTTPSSSTTPQSLSESDTTFHSVTVNLSGLTPGGDYCVTLVAHNGSGDSGDGPIPFTQGLPFANSFDAVATGASTADVTGSVNPTGQSTTYHVDYAPSSDAWCTSGGSSGTPTSTSNESLGATDTDDHEVTVHLSGLTAGTEYCAELVATNGSGSAQGGQVTFTAGAPVADTFGGQSTGASSATISGQVNPSGQTTTYYVDYDESGSNFCNGTGAAAHTTSGSAGTVPATDSTFHDVSVGLTGLTGGPTFCAELVAHNGSGTSRGGRVTFTVGAPQAAIGNVSSTGATTADVNGSVNPGGRTTDYHADYDESTSDWCQSGGTTGSPAHSTSPASLGATDTDFHNVTIALSSLVSGTEYCVQLVAHNSAATDRSGQVTFIAGAPGVDAFDVTTSGSNAVVSGSVNPAGQSGTAYRADYATVGSAFCNSNGNSGTPTQSTPTTLPASDNTDHDVSVSFGGLTPGTHYCVLIEATNGSGTSKSFPLEFIAGAPVVSLDAPASTGPSSETLNGTVNPSSQATTYHFEYADVTSTWCGSGGTTGPFTSAPDPAGSAGSGSADQPVSAPISGLTQGHGYCFRLVATNAAGTTSSGFDEFTAGSTGLGPGAGTQPASGVTTSGATLNGTVNPQGESTTYEFEYDTAGSSFCTGNGAPAHTTATQVLSATDTSNHAVNATIGGLSPSTTYCYRVVAHNADGDTNGPKVQFTTQSAGGGNPGGGNPSGGGNPGGTGGTEAAASLTKAGSAKTTLKGKSIIVDTGVKGTCPSSAGGKCSESGQITATLPKGKASAAKKKAKPVTLGKVHGSIPAGSTARIKVKLSSKGAKLLRKYKRLKATITVTIKTPAGKKTTIKRTVTLKAPKAKKKH